MNILKEYNRIMQAENALKAKSIGEPRSKLPLTPIEMRWKAEQIMELAKNSMTPRSHARDYDLWFFDGPVNKTSRVVPLGATLRTPVMVDEFTGKSFTHESVGAHTNLLQTLVRYGLTVRYGADFGEPDGTHPRTEDGYSLSDIVEAVTLHDLPENRFGDWRDNGNINSAEKTDQETRFWQEYGDKYSPAETEMKLRAMRLLRQKDLMEAPTAKLFHVADKAAAPLMMLAYDSLGRFIILPRSKAQPNTRDETEMNICDWSYSAGPDTYYRASEMWSIDFFKLRKFTEIDDTMFYTGLLVMLTLIVNGQWYTWRENDYANA